MFRVGPIQIESFKNHVYFSQLLGKCRNDGNCPKGLHGLEKHQLPICHYYLKMCCSKDPCTYLHIKHQDSLENCLSFQRGICLLGLKVCLNSTKNDQFGFKCKKPHRYNSWILNSRCKRIEEDNDASNDDGLVWLILKFSKKRVSLKIEFIFNTARGNMLTMKLREKPMKRLNPKLSLNCQFGTFETSLQLINRY